MSETKSASVSETLEKHTMKVMQKLESRIPLQIKSFSDFSREYLRLLEEIYDIDYTLEKKIFGNFGMDEKSIKMLDSYLEIGSKFFTSQIDMSNELFKGYLNMRLSMMESYNKLLKEFSTNIRNDTTDTTKTDKIDQNKP